MFKILVVEDDLKLRKLIVDLLIKENYDVYSCDNGESAIDLVFEMHIDAVITDIMMPVMDGMMLTKKLRQINEHLPIIMITAKESWNDKKHGFELGVDDYLIKPINLDELLYRLKAVLRRSKISSEHQIIVGDITFNYQNLSVESPSKSWDLPKKEFELIYKLLSYPKKIFTRNQLLDEIWGYDSNTDIRTIDVHIKRLREKFERIDEFEIVTVRGLGYKLEKHI